MKIFTKFFILFLAISINYSLFTIHCIYAGVAGKVNSGNRSYKKGNFQKSLDKYSEAEMQDPNNPVVHYNKGTALYKMGQYDDAQNEFNKALSLNDNEFKSRVYYNLGNNAYKKQNTEEALNYYKKAIDLNPKDEDAKYNYEFIKYAKMNPQNQQGKGKNKEGKDKDKNKNDKDKNNKDKQEQSKAEENKKDKMSKEDAQRILQYFDENDRNSAEKRKLKMPQLPKVDEDW